MYMSTYSVHAHDLDLNKDDNTFRCCTTEKASKFTHFQQTTTLKNVDQCQKLKLKLTGFLYNVFQLPEGNPPPPLNPVQASQGLKIKVLLNVHVCKEILR